MTQHDLTGPHGGPWVEQGPGKRLLGELLVEEGLISHAQLLALLRGQRDMPPAERKPIGRLAVESGILSETQLRRVLDTHGKRLALGELLVARGSITRDQLALALARQSDTGGLLGEVLISLGLLDEVTLAERLAEQCDLAYVPLGADDPLEPDLVRWVNPNYAQKHGVLPIGRLGRRLTVALWHPQAINCVDELSLATGLVVRAVLTTRTQLLEHMAALYGASVSEKGVTPGRAAAGSGDRPGIPLEGAGPSNAWMPAGLDLLPQEARGLDLALRNGDGAVVVTGPANAKLEEIYLALWRHAREVSASTGDRTVEGVGDIQTSRAAERLFRSRQGRSLRLGYLAANNTTDATQHLLDLGVRSDRLGLGLLAALAVCSTRRVCEACADPHEPRPLLLAEWVGTAPLPPDVSWRKGRGCPACDKTGYAGEVLPAELWLPNERERKALVEGTPIRKIREGLLARMEGLGLRAFRVALRGQATIEDLSQRIPTEEVRAARASFQVQKVRRAA